ncbi:MAG: DNA polymerase III subunit delta [Coriobacteriia bacterium]|jgi:DNA polymerase-3 subunit delta|nr:DNA polymerase III subunit delta [Coriobacteriia bacterium]MDR2714158.1 DNA polymerase III subunit delta [Coriobacteriales bacterium]
MSETKDTKKEPKLLNAYLFAGSDDLKRESLLKRLMKRLSKDCDLTLNAQFFDAAQVKEPNDVIDACNTMPFLSPLRLVAVKTADKASKPLMDALVAYLAAPCETTVLVLEAEKLAKNSRLITAIKKLDAHAYIDCSEKKRNELPALVQTMARARGTELSLDVARHLIELVGTSTLALDKELEKLAAFVVALGRTNITSNDLAAVVSRSLERSPWDLVDAFANRQAGAALAALSELKNETPVDLLRLCVMRLRELLTVKALQERGLSGERALAEAMGRPDWQVRRLTQAARNYSSAELRGLLVRAADMDKKMKSGFDAHLLLSQFLLEA